MTQDTQHEQKCEIRHRDKNKMCVLVTLLIVIKYPTRSSLSEEGLPGIIAWVNAVHCDWEGMITGIWVTCSQKQKEIDASMQSAFSVLFSMEVYPVECCHPYSSWVFPPQSNLSGNTQRDLFPWWLKYNQADNGINHHNIHFRRDKVRTLGFCIMCEEKRK